MTGPRLRGTMRELFVVEEAGVLAFGAYLPARRLQRALIAEAYGWFNPGLKGMAKGERAVADWDEDSVTLCVEAARDCLSDMDRSAISALYMASTSFPFQDRQNAGIVANALNLRSGMLTLDVASSGRAGTSALAVALQSPEAVLVVAGEKRRSRAGGAQEMLSGDAGAALLVGRSDKVLARLIGTHTEAVDFVDHFHGTGEAFGHAGEERWVRDEGYMKIVPAAIRALLDKAGVDAGGISAFCFPAAARGVAALLAGATGVPSSAVRDNLQSRCGEAGAAHPLLMLVHALEEARPGDRILVMGFGQGSDVLLFEATDALAQWPRPAGVGAHLARRREETRYCRHLAFNDLVAMERGMRAELDKATGLSTLYRNRDMSQGLVGGRCLTCGTQQFPKSNICVNPDCGAMGTQEDQGFSGQSVRLRSCTADHLTYSPNPPAYYGMVEFEGGAKLMSDFTDVDRADELSVGMRMRMMFRIKDYDDRRGFRRYFWKASPLDVYGTKAEG